MAPPVMGGLREDSGGGGGGLRIDDEAPQQARPAPAAAQNSFAFLPGELQEVEVMMRRKMWRETADKLGFGARRGELLSGKIDPEEVHRAVRDFVSRRNALRARGANFAHLTQIHMFPKFNNWIEQLAAFERLEPAECAAKLQELLIREVRQWLETRAREFFENDGVIDASEWTLLLREAGQHLLSADHARGEVLAICRRTVGDEQWHPPAPREDGSARKAELVERHRELEAAAAQLEAERQRASMILQQQHAEVARRAAEVAAREQQTHMAAAQVAQIQAHAHHVRRAAEAELAQATAMRAYATGQQPTAMMSPGYAEPIQYSPYTAYGQALQQVPQVHYDQAMQHNFAVQVSARSKVIAGVLQLFLGFVGAGRFYTGDKGIAIAQLAVTLVTGGVGAIWPLIDAIHILFGNAKDVDGRRIVRS